MRVIIITGLLGAVIGAAVGWMNAADHYNTKATRLAEAQRAAEQKRIDGAKTEVDYYAKKYIEALNVEPVTTVERVYVKASCVPTNSSTGVGDEARAGTVELGDAANRSFRAVARRAESQYQQCATQLGAAQALLRVIR